MDIVEEEEGPVFIGKPAATRTVSARVTPLEHEKLLDYCNRLGLSPSQVLRGLIREAVELPVVWAGRKEETTESDKKEESAATRVRKQINREIQELGKNLLKG